MVDFLNYDTSPLNPFLKAIIPIIFLGALIAYGYIRQFYHDKIRSFIDMLLLFILFVAISGILRFYGDGTDFGFSKAYSLKWFQSVTLLTGAVFFYACRI
jgi:hypothetical protein